MPRPPSLTKHLRAIRRAVAKLEASFAKVSTRLRRAEREAARKVQRKRRPLTITPARRAQLKLQGTYMGTIRQLGPRQKAKVKAVKEQRGMEAAIRVARRLRFEAVRG